MRGDTDRTVLRDEVNRSTSRIAIVGAGIAGLSAALALHDRGIAAEVFEAADRVGGRMHSDTEAWEDGQTSEWCAELIDTEHTTILGLAARFSLPVVDLWHGQPPGSEDTLFFDGAYYPRAQADEEFGPVMHVLEEQVKAAGYPTTYDHFTDTARELDRLSIHQWIARYVPGGHHSLLGKLLDVAYRIEFGWETEDQSSLNLVHLLGFQQDPRHFAMFGESDERFHIEGGNERLPRAMAEYISSGATPSRVHLEHRVTRIAQRDGRCTLTVEDVSGRRDLEFDAVIVTIPFGVLRGLDYAAAGFDDLKREAIESLGYGDNSKLNLQFRSRFWQQRGPWHGCSNGNIYSDLPLQNTWHVTRSQPGTPGIIVDMRGGQGEHPYSPEQPYSRSRDSETTAQYAERFLDQLERVWPGARSQYTGLAALSDPIADPNIRGSHSVWRVGQVTRFAGYEGVRQGAIYFAGEHCSVEFQGYMEGAAREGIRAAGEVLERLAVPAG
jgi:monoamine oxidase